VKIHCFWKPDLMGVIVSFCSITRRFRKKLNQTTGLWHTVAQVEKIQAVRSERRRASGEVEERDTSGLPGLRLRSA
jgi:hypothetical protein